MASLHAGVVAVAVHDAKVVLGLGVTLLCGTPVPFSSLVVVLWYTKADVVHGTQ